jgi:hypothetical protein
MKVSFLAAFAIITGAGVATHADEPMATQQAIDTSLERRIENALKDLEIFNARALRVDAEAIAASRPSEACSAPGRR